MKLKITLTLLFAFLYHFANSQGFCKAPNYSANQEFSNLSSMLFTNTSNEEMLCINVYYHIVRDNNGSNNSNPIRTFELGGITSDLNTKYNPHNISFHNSGYDYIDNTLLNDLQNSEIDPLLAINNVSNAINIYIVNNVTAGWNGFAKTIPGRNLIIAANAALSHVVSHEVGHCLNLYHTHHGHSIAEPASSTYPDACEELIDGSNNTVCGDYVQDTPADSGLRVDGIDYTNISCTYTKGDGYNPDTKNIMSYTRPNCLEHFTNGQGIRMRDAILNSPVLQPVLNCSCTVAAFFGNSTICSTETATYTIPCNNSSFTVSPNLQTISSTSNSITIKPANSSVNGSAFVEATINGNSYQKEIWVGKPKADVQLTPEGNYVFMELVGVNSNIHEQNITAIKWETESSIGNATMGQLIDRFENLAHGNNYNWSINAKITLTNDCGTTILHKYIISPEPQPCEGNYRIAKTDKNEYNAYRIIDPCARSTTKNNIEKVKDKEIKEAALFDIYGLKVKTYSKNSFSTDYLKKGVYIFKVRINEIGITKKIIVE